MMMERDLGIYLRPELIMSTARLSAEAAVQHTAQSLFPDMPSSTAKAAAATKTIALTPRIGYVTRIELAPGACWRAGVGRAVMPLCRFGANCPLCD